MNFSNFITEAASGKNLHMEHIEDNILNGGVYGAREAINFLRSLRDMLAGNSESKVNVTVKWDGAPAIFAGQDPSDGQFFVAKKGIFNKNPKLYKTTTEIDADTSGDLADKLKACLKYLPEIGIKGVIQGDLMYTKSDLKNVTIDGEKYTTFHPNTLVYAVPYDSDMARIIRNSQMGIIWHTRYDGDTLESMKAVFGTNILSGMKQSKNVWYDNADYKDVSGKASMTKEETAEITKILSQAGKIFNAIDGRFLDSLSDYPGFGEELNTKIKAFNNSKVKKQEKISNVHTHVTEMLQTLHSFYESEYNAKKKADAKQKALTKVNAIKAFMAPKYKVQFEHIFTLMNLIVDAKNVLSKKLDEVKSVNTFLLTKSGYQVTGVEGYVAIDKLSGGAVKIVDRLRFSYANFSPEIIKGWER